MYEACGKRGSGRGWPIRKHRFIFLGSWLIQRGSVIRSVFSEEKRKRKVKPLVGRKEERKSGIIPRPFLKLIFSSASVWSLWLFRFFFPPIPFRPPFFYRRQTLSAAADENWLASHHSLRFGRGSHRTMRYHDSRYLHRMPPLLKSFLPLVFSRRKITAKVIPLLPNRTVSINWQKKLNIGEDIERGEFYIME